MEALLPQGMAEGGNLKGSRLGLFFCVAFVEGFWAVRGLIRFSGCGARGVAQKA